MFFDFRQREERERERGHKRQRDERECKRVREVQEGMLGGKIVKKERGDKKRKRQE